MNNELSNSENNLNHKNVDEKLQILLKKISAEKQISESVINSLPGIFYMFDQKGKFVNWNKNLEIVSEYSNDEVSKKSPLNFFSGETKKRIATKILTVFTKGEASVEGELITKNGKRIPHYLTGKRIKINNKSYLLGVGVDISKRKQAELLQNVVFQISKATTSDISLDVLYNSIHTILKQVLDVTNFYIAYYDDKEKLLSFPFYSDAVETFPTSSQPLGKGLTEYILRTGKPLLANKNKIKALAKKGEIEIVGTLSELWMGAPLKIKNKVIGVIAVNSYDDPNLYSESDLKIFSFVSEQIAKAIEYKKMLTDIQVEKTYLDELFTFSPEALSLVTTDSIIIQVNKRFTTLFGYSGEEAFGRNIDELLVPDDYRVDARKYTKEVAIGKRLDFETIRKRKDGTLINVSVLGSPVKYKGDLLAVYVVYRDITSRIKAAELIKKSEERYRALSNELIESNSMKELLLDVIAHDLKNPAGVIKGFSDIALENDPKNEMLQEISSGTDSLLKVIENATVMAKVSAGDEIEMKEIDITETIRTVSKEFTSALKYANMELNLKLTKPLKIKANPIIAEVFRNYINNAIKYASSGGKIVINAIEDKNNITINVTDFGETIPKKDRKNIFKRRVQLGKTSGSGLGLAIVSRIAKAHNADAGVEQNKPNGNIFYLKIPNL